MTVDLFRVEEPETEIRESEHISYFDVQLNGLPTTIEIRKFRARLLALCKDIPGHILGFRDFLSNKSAGYLSFWWTGALEGRFILVEQEYQRNGLGKILMDSGIEFARSCAYKYFILYAERPGLKEVKEGKMTVEQRDKLFPLSTNDLMSIYEKWGFRRLENKEIKHYCVMLDAHAPMHRAPRIVEPNHPRPSFGKGPLDRILSHYYSKNKKLSFIDMKKLIRARTDWSGWHKKVRELEENNYTNSENYSYLKHCMVKEI